MSFGDRLNRLAENCRVVPPWFLRHRWCDDVCDGRRVSETRSFKFTQYVDLKEYISHSLQNEFTAVQVLESILTLFRWEIERFAILALNLSILNFQKFLIHPVLGDTKNCGEKIAPEIEIGETNNTAGKGNVEVVTA